MKMKSKVLWVQLIIFGLVVSLLAVEGLAAPAPQTAKKQQRSEQEEDYFKKWLDEDVKYIISDQEKDVFKKLATADEKEQFIEQFWHRRDPDIRTAINDVKEEHYRRIAYANDHFASGFPGWRTDRGRTYIIHGEPVEIERHPTGGMYDRPHYEGGGSTATYAFEIWRYRYIEGIGLNVELEFVDPSGTGEYRLALMPDEKDALLNIDGVGLTLAESLGIMTKSQRPRFSPGNYGTYPMMGGRIQDDNPFIRYERYAMVMKAQPVKYTDLKEIVEIDVRYDELPFLVRSDHIQLNENQFLVPVTIEVANKDLTFKLENGQHVAKVAVYGIVESLTNKIIEEFEDDIAMAYSPEQLTEGLKARSLYQKILVVDKGMRYKVTIILKDLNSLSTGVVPKAIVLPRVDPDQLATSSLILSNFMAQLEEAAEPDQMFVLGDIWIRPTPSRQFMAGDGLAAYLQAYNAHTDQTTMAPSLKVKYQLSRDGQVVFESTNSQGEGLQYYSDQRIVLTKVFPSQVLLPGRYTVQVDIEDLIGDLSTTAREKFRVAAPAAASGSE